MSTRIVIIVCGSLPRAIYCAYNKSVVRRAYGERRQCALALLDERLYFVAYVDREDGRRIISLRKANKREVRFYVKVSED